LGKWFWFRIVSHAALPLTHFFGERDELLDTRQYTKRKCETSLTIFHNIISFSPLSKSPLNTTSPHHITRRPFIGWETSSSTDMILSSATISDGNQKTNTRYPRKNNEKATTLCHQACCSYHSGTCFPHFFSCLSSVLVFALFEHFIFFYSRDRIGLHLNEEGRLAQLGLPAQSAVAHCGGPA